jgi:hypothetical protein
LLGVRRHRLLHTYVYVYTYAYTNTSGGSIKKSEEAAYS